MDDRETFIKQFVQAGKARGASKEEVASKLDAALKEYDNAKTTTAQPEGKSVGGFLQNVLSSGGEAVKDIGSAAVNTVNPNPDENTLVNIARLPFGLGEILAQKVTGKNPNYTDRNMESVKAVGNFYKDRYGGEENIKNTLYNDPVGSLLDISTLLDGGASAVGAVGKGAKISSLARAGEIGSKVASTVDPIQMALKATGKVGSAVRSGGGKVADLAENEAKNIPLQGVKISPTQMQKFEKETGVSVPNFIKDEGLTGNPVELGVQKAEQLQNSYDDMVLRSGKTISKQELASAFDNQIQELRSGDNKFIEDADNIAKKLEQKRDFMLKAFGDEDQIPLEQVVAIRKQTDKLIPKNQFNTDAITASVDTQTRRVLNDAVYSKLGDDGVAKATGKKLSQLYKFNDYVSKTNLPSTRSKLIGTVRAVSGGAVLANPSLLPAAIAAYIGSKALENPRVLATGSNLIEGGAKAVRNGGSAVADKIASLQRMLQTINATGRKTGGREVLRNSNR